MDQILDEYGQPINRYFNAKRNATKAFENLLGIVQGMQGDRELTDGEVVYLQNWLSDQEYIANDPDVIDLLDALDSILEDGVITDEEKEDLKCLLSDFLEYRDEFDYIEPELQASLKRTIGVFAGVSADDVLSDNEVLFLDEFIKSMADARYHWPLSAVHKTIENALEDGYLSGAEKEAILANLYDAVGGAFSVDGVASGKTTTLPLDDIECLEIEGKVFCFTGIMAWGTRRECHSKVEELGGIVSKGVTKKVDYLVLGGIASADWFNTSYGRKIEKAVKYRDEVNTGILLVSEESWSKAF